jgi:hypothetical protein
MVTAFPPNPSAQQGSSAMSDSALVVFTSRGFTTILNEGGSQAWVLDPRRARNCAYLVCTQNRHDREWGSPEDPHGAAFLVGKID